MVDSAWRAEFLRLADAYYHATGSAWPAPTGSLPITVTDETLAKMYVDSRMTLTQIAELFNSSAATVSAHLQRHGIKVRGCGEYPRTDAQLENIKRAQKARWPDGAKPKTGKPKRDPAHRFISSSGYVLCKSPEHPRADVHGYVPEHTLIMEALIGRYLAEDEVVHHINRKRWDNAPENLQLMKKGEHHALHGRENIKFARAALAKKTTVFKETHTDGTP